MLKVIFEVALNAAGEAAQGYVEERLSKKVKGMEKRRPWTMFFVVAVLGLALVAFVIWAV